MPTDQDDWRRQGQEQDLPLSTVFLWVCESCFEDFAAEFGWVLSAA